MFWTSALFIKFNLYDMVVYLLIYIYLPYLPYLSQITLGVRKCNN